MAKYAISEEGAEAMLQLANSISSAYAGLREASTSLRNNVLSSMSELGIYGMEIWNIALSLSGILDDHEETFSALAESARKKSDDIRQLLNPSFSDSANESGSLTGMQGGKSNSYREITNTLKKANVGYLPLQIAPQGRTDNDIISSLSGGDETEGSCSSLAFAYVGNKAGYIVLDFRDGRSRVTFSTRSTISKIASLPGVNATIIQGRNDIENVYNLLNTMAPGKEYYLATGQHAAIVRRNGSHFEYLELQHPSTENGWHILHDYALIDRFGCSFSHSCDFSNYLMDVDSLSHCREFLDILGYINTDRTMQRKGRNGNVR